MQPARDLYSEITLKFQNKTKQKLYSNSTGNSSLSTELSKHI